MKGAKPPYGDLLRKLRLSPQNVSFFQSPYARHRVSSPKPPSERSQNPKAWGNWEGIGDFCLQKCQRGRQLSPLSEATRLDSAATPRAVFLNLFWDSRFKITAKRASLVLRVEFGDRRIGKANRRKGQRPFLILFRSEQRELLSRRVKLGFRRWLWGKTAMACVLSVRTHCSFFPETPYQA